MRLYIVAGKATDSVTYGFLPAAARLGLGVTILTDRPTEHAGAEVVDCDVTDARAIVAAISRHRPPDGVFSNSDHLQTPTALAAEYFDLPGKDWRAALRAKDKALMRRTLGTVATTELRSTADPDSLGPPFPAVVKPREGVAGEDVYLVADTTELAARCHEIRRRRPGDTLVVEPYLPGPLYTLETLGDGRTRHVLGSFRTTLSAPPHFVEERLDRTPPPPEHAEVTAALDRLGVGFGACHTEFVVHEGHAEIIEVNYRVIGDHCDFLLADLLDYPLFEHVLRAHLGEEVPPPVPSDATATVDYVLAHETGTLTAAPGPADAEADGVRLTYRPMRATGDAIACTRTNRDYLGAVRAVGSDRERVELAVKDFRTRHRWEITR